VADFCNGVLRKKPAVLDSGTSRIVSDVAVAWIAAGDGGAFHWVRNPAEFGKIAEYIERNPVKAGLVSQAADWKWSSAGHPIR
jgi:hypothetical protein